MEEEKGYDVLKFVVRGERCYVSMDYIEGKPLIKWLKYHNRIPKEQIYRWMQEIIDSLEQFHKLRGNPCYRYMNPYSIIVSEEEKLYLLDLGSQNQEELLLRMQRRGVRENFLSPENQYYQKASVKEDIYGLGKTLQYILAAADITPPLSRREEAVFRKIISRCLNQNSKKTYQTVQEISEHFPEKKEKKKIKKTKKYFIIIVGIAAAAGCIGTTAGLFQSGDKEEVTKESYQEQEKNPETENQKKMQTDEEPEELTSAETSENYRIMVYDMGLLYFLELKDYQNSRETFRKLEGDSLAEDYVSLCGYFLNQPEERIDRELERLLARMEEEIPDTEDERYYFTLIKGYELLDIEEAVQERIRLGEMCMNMEGWKQQDGSREKEIYLKKILAAAYEQTGEEESAVQQYTELLEMEEEQTERAKLFSKLAVLYDRAGNVEQAIESCKKGLEENKNSIELANLMIRFQCAAPAIDGEVCAETIKEFLNEIPGLAESEEFQKLQQEYEIRIEEDQVWVGR